MRPHTKEPVGSRIIRVDDEVYSILTARKAELMNERQRDVSFNEVLKDYLHLTEESVGRDA